MTTQLEMFSPGPVRGSVTINRDVVHRHQDMHTNSIKAYREGQKPMGDRALSVLRLFAAGDAMTDRQVLDRLYPGSDDLNRVRPRITELIDAGHLEECGAVTCSVTGKTVRVCRMTRGIS